MEDLETKLKLAETQNFKWIVTDGVFSMDGDIAPLDKIVFLAKKYNALVLILKKNKFLLIIRFSLMIRMEQAG